MSRPIVHVIPYHGCPPLCGFTEEIDPRKWPANHDFRNKWDSLTWRFVEDFTDMITCSICREKFKAEWKTLRRLQSGDSGPYQLGKNPNLAVDIGD